jgi:uncharacterized HhH-GPD family protein
MATASATPKPLYITGKPDADKLLHTNGLALMIGMLLDQQVPMEWAFTGAYTIKQRIGHCDAKKIAAMDADAFVTMCCTKPAIHRFPASMAKRIYDMSTIIAAEYKGKAENIWNDVEDAEELRARLRKLPGWKIKAGEFSDNQPRSVADIYSAATLLKVRAYKQMQRANDLDKKDRPKR